jgi:hypothetical protein
MRHLLAAVSLAAVVVGCAGSSVPVATATGIRSLLAGATLVSSDDFHDLANWTPEGTCPPRAESGALVWPCGGADGIGTIWYNRPIEGPMMVTYTVMTRGGMQNINFIAYARHPAGLLETTRQRTGAYPEYQAFPNYIVTFLTNGEARWRVRFRRDPGFTLLSETFSDMDTTSSVAHRVAHVFDGKGRIALYVDDSLVHASVDTASPYREGYVGLRTWRTTLSYRDFRVYRLHE